MPTSSAPIRVLVAGAGAFGSGASRQARAALRRDRGRRSRRQPGRARADPIAPRRRAMRCGSLAVDRRCGGRRHHHRHPGGFACRDLRARARPRTSACCWRSRLRRRRPTPPRCLRSCADSAGFVLPGHVLRFSQDHVRLVEIVRSGRIGEVIYVNSRRYRDDSHVLALSRHRPCPDDPDPRHRPGAMGHEFRFPLGSRPPIGGRRLPVDDGGLRNHDDRGDLRLAHRLDLRRRRLAPRSAGGGRRSRQRRVGRRTRPARLRRGAPRGSILQPRRMTLCGTNRIIFWPVSATGRARQRSICGRRSPD